VAQKWRVARLTSNRNSPLADRAALEQLALRYVERYATTRARLAGYLRRKLFERGWDGPGDPPVEAIVARMAELRYVDDRQFAEMRTASLVRRGYGARRIDAALRAAGVARDDVGPGDDDRASQAALNFMRRKRIGPFAVGAPDPVASRRAFAAMLRAGHAPDLVRKLLDPRNSDYFPLDE